jgi:inosose dehydratase
MPSFYTNSTLHTDDWTASVESVVRVAGEAAALLDTQVAVVNPTPIRWGQPLDKSDGELATQARALQTLAERLAVHGVRLAYHTHDAEMRHAAREFHHMLLATDPAVVGLCLDAHWIYRGAGNSQIALFDIVQLYGARVVSLHLRQSRNGVWTETLDEADGADLDYARLAQTLQHIGFAGGPVILEQAAEAGTPDTLPPAEVYRRNADWTRRTFAFLFRDGKP